jgi:hypothetical protein
MEKLFIVIALLFTIEAHAFDFNALVAAIPQGQAETKLDDFQIIFHPRDFDAIREIMIVKYGIPRQIKGHVKGLPFTKCEWRQGDYRVIIQTVHDSRYMGAVRVIKRAR